MGGSPEFQAKLGYTVRPCIKTKAKTIDKKKRNERERERPDKEVYVCNPAIR